MPPVLTRRRLLAGLAGVAGLAATGGVAGAIALAGGGDGTRLVVPDGEAVAKAEAARRRAGASTITATLTPRPVSLDLGGLIVATWGYTEAAPGPVIRAKAGDLVRVDVVNQLPVDTSVHWHGIALRNDMDGVPGLTQKPIAAAGGRYTYEFTAPDPGTYFYHPHSGVQLDRALYGVLIIDDPNDAGRYDQEWIVVLDDWVDGTGRTPDDVMASLTSMNGMHGHMGHMHHGGMETMVSPLLGGAGDVEYPHYLINGRVPTAPARHDRPNSAVRSSSPVICAPPGAYGCPTARLTVRIGSPSKAA